MTNSPFSKYVILLTLLYISVPALSQQKQIINIPLACTNNIDSNKCQIITVTRTSKNDTVIIKLPECVYGLRGVLPPHVSMIKEKDYNYYSSKRFKRQQDRSSKKEVNYDPEKGYQTFGRKIKIVRKSTGFFPEFDLTNLKDGVYYISGNYHCADVNLMLKLKKG